MQKNKFYSAIAMFLILTITVTLFALPNANAQGKVKTYPFIEAVPNPVGVNQATLINFGLLNFLNSENDGFNITISITKPDNTTETLGPYKTWSTGNAGKYYTPDQVGTYYLQTIYPGEWYNTTGFGASQTFFDASQSDKYALTVQEQAVPSYPGQALPAEYWTRPIDDQIREWWSIAGSWVATPNNLYAPYNDGPESPHILWTKPIGDSQGGLVGGDLGVQSMGDGDAYEGKFASSVIINGILFYNKYPGFLMASAASQEVVAVDLHTGETLWSKNLGVGSGRIFAGQTLYWDSRNYRGAFTYLWISSGGGFFSFGPENWYAFDPLSGTLVYNMTDVPAGTNYRGANGEILKYFLTNTGNTTNPNWRLQQWNSSWTVTNGKTGMSESWGSQVQGVSFNATQTGYDINVPVSAGSTLPGGILRAFPGDRVIGGSVSQTEINLWALSLRKGSEGTVLFNTKWAAPAEWVEGNITTGGIGQSGWCAWSQEDMVGVFFTKENRVHYGFSLANGSYLWQTKPQVYSDAWSDTVSLTFGPDRVIAYNTLYSATVGGVVYAYNIGTGNLKWTYNATDPYHESYISNYWWTVPLFVTDGKIYIGHMEHSALNPKPRGAPFICLNATDGTLVFRSDGLFRQSRWGGRAIIGDSIIATQDTYNQRVYAIGKGPSAITVSAPDIAAPFNTPVIVKGTVTDISPGTRDDAIDMRFPDGVPVVSDDSMSEWMLYVYKQFSRPTDATGVPISIDATDPNGNYVHIGDTTSDGSGNFHFTFTPTMSGDYIVFATFAGSKSFYPTFTQTAMTVMEAQPTASATPAPAQMPYELYTIGMGVAIIIAIAIAVLVLRRRP